MNIITKDTNVFILFGDGAAAHYSELVNCWSRLISAQQWDSFQFFLAGTEIPPLALEESAKNLVGDRNTIFYRIAEKGSNVLPDTAPDASTYHNIIFDKVKTGNVRLHVVYDSGEKELPDLWLSELLRAAMLVESLTTSCMFYLLFGRNSPAPEQRMMMNLLAAHPGSSVFLLGDTNESGARVPPEDRLQATFLAMLMNAAGLMPVGRGAYSLGYSALNANGSELRRLRESAACRAISEELSKTVDSLSSDLNLELLPEGVDSTAGLYSFLQRCAQEKTPQLSATALRNAWITIRMDPDLAPTEAVRRMQRFADLNYAGGQNAEIPARELAWLTEKNIRNHMKKNVGTTALSDRVLVEIAEAFRRIAEESVQPAGCAYPKKPMTLLFGRSAQKEEYLQQCKTVVLRSVKEYIVRKNVCTFAAEMEKAYRNLAAWVRKARGENDAEGRRITARDLLDDLQKQLDSGDEGNALRIGRKYPNYSGELASLHPTLSSLTEGMDCDFFREDGTLQEANWRRLIASAGKQMEKRLSPAFRGDFFRVLAAEFSTPDERERFFDEYLKSGPRMYMNLSAEQSRGTDVLLADDRLTDRWFFGKELYEVRTDNAENLTLYPLGEEHPEKYLGDDKVYFKGRSSGAGSMGTSLFRNATGEVQRPAATAAMPKNRMFAGEERDASGADSRPVTASGHERIRLEPDEKNMYRLYWDWRGNDETAMVEFFQFGEKVGKVAVISVRRFKENGDNMNVTDEIMGGKPLPAGTLTVTIRDARQEIFADSVELPGRRDVIRYKVNNRQLQLQPEKSGIVENVVLRTTETDGTRTYYPLYSGGEKPWFFEGLTLSDGKIVVDPTRPGGTVYPVEVGG